MLNKILKYDLIKFLFFFVVIVFVILINKKYTFAIESLKDNDILADCSNPKNCVLETWKVRDANKSFTELIDILKNTPRIKLIDIREDYLHALAKSRVMKFIDDIEIKKIEKESVLKVKSKSRNGFYDLGVNKRRINTLHFRLIDIYK